jgi:hypothetical protein
MTEFLPWPAIPLDDNPSPPDEGEAVQIALAHLPELVLRRYLLQELDADTLPAARQALQASNPLLGSAPAAEGGIKSLLLIVALRRMAGDGAEVESRRSQMAKSLAEREDATVGDIRQAVRAVTAHLDLAALARARVASWQTKVAELDEKVGRGITSFAEMVVAKQEWLKARGDLMSELMAWQIARVKLRLAEGLLAEECGYGGARACGPR